LGLLSLLGLLGLLSLLSLLSQGTAQGYYLFRALSFELRASGFQLPV